MFRSCLSYLTKLLIFTFCLLLNFHLDVLSANNDFTELIQNVQLNSQRTYNAIQSVSFKGISDSYIYFGYSPLDVQMIPMKEILHFEGFWMKPDSFRMVIKALRKIEADTSGSKVTSGFGPLPNPFQFIYEPSALGMLDSKKRQGVLPLYPFAVGADSFYHYALVNEVGFGENKVISVHVEPRDQATPAVIGTFQIDKNRQVVVGSDVITNDASSFQKAQMKREKKGFSLGVQGYENHRIETKKTLFYDSYWLPTEVKEEFYIKVLGFRVKVHRNITFSDYFINPDLPDSTEIVNKKVIYDPDPELEKKVIAATPFPQRLSRQEQEKIFKEIKNKFASRDVLNGLLESEALATEAFKMGVEQQVGRYLRFTRRLGNYFWYNRVEGLRLNYDINISNLLLKNSIISLNGGYGFKDQRWKGSLAWLQFLDAERKIFIEGNLYQKLNYEEGERLITTGKNTLSSFLYKGDYRDYYYQLGGNLNLGYRFSNHLAVKFSVLSQTEQSASCHTRFSLFNRKEPFRLNPEIAEGELRGIRATLMYQAYEFDTDLLVEYADKKSIPSDFSYTLVKANLQRHFRLTYHTHLRLLGTTALALGDLPPQRWFDLGGKTFMNYYGNLRGVDYKAFTGDKLVAGVIDYTLNGGALYDLMVRFKPLRAFKLTFWSGFGWSSLSNQAKKMAHDLNTPLETTDGWYHEFGVGIGDYLNIFRLDFIRNSIAENRILFRVNFLR